MKKFSSVLAILAPVLVLGACSSTNPQKDAANNENDAAFAPHIYQFHSGDRAPSSDCEASASWQPSSAAITVGPGGGSRTQVVTINQVQNCTKKVWLNDGTCYQDVPSPDGSTTPVTYTSYANCGAVSGGNGKSPLWNAYYTASSDQRAAALAAAIKGVGLKTATDLEKAQTFDGPGVKKPKTWDQFSQMINDAANANPPVISKSVRTQVLGTYAADT